MSALVLLPLIVLQAPPTAPEPPGRRIDLDGATLFLPQGYTPEGGRVDVVLHLHGAPSVVEPALVATGWRAALIEFNRKGLSSVYTAPFADTELFPRLLEKARKAVQAEGIAADPTIGRVVVSSFSAGFGGVRELLKVPAHVDRIDALVLADSLYSGYAGDPADRRLDPDKMDGFLRFAAEAARGRKAMLVTHSAQVPYGYASTTETADALTRAVDGTPKTTRLDWGDGWIQTRRFEKGRLLVLGFAGTEGADHMRHLRNLAPLWKALPDPFPPRR
jgi:hypothetical protein